MSFDDPNESISWFHPENCSGWEFLIAHRSSHLWAIYHENYTICASQDFGQTWKYRSQIHNLTTPGSMLIEPGEVHRTLCVPPNIAFKVVQIPPAEVGAAAQELGIGVTPHFRRAQTEDPRLNKAVWQLGLAIEQNNSDLLYLQTLQMETMQCLLGHTEYAPRLVQGSLDHHALNRAKSYLHENHSAVVPLEVLAKIAHLSKYRLVHAFTRKFGLPPHAYQIHVRVERARQLLRQGVSGADMAMSLGFADQTHFIRHFKRIMQVTPGEYSRSIGIKPCFTSR